MKLSDLKPIADIWKHLYDFDVILSNALYRNIEFITDNR